MTGFLVSLMLAAAAQGVMGIQPQQRKPLYDQVVSRTTHQNGYEEYVRAGDLLESRYFDLYRMWSPNALQNFQDELESLKDPADFPRRSADEIRSDIEVMKQLHAAGHLGRRRLVLGRYEKVLMLVRQGNTKPVFYPGERDALATYPELAGIKNIGHLLMAEAYVKFAEGEPKNATSALLEALTISNKIGELSLLHFLVAISMRSVALASIEEHLSVFSWTEAQRLYEYSQQLLTASPAIAKVMRGEEEHLMRTVKPALENPTKYILDPLDIGQPSPLAQRIAKLSPAQIQTLTTKVQTRVREEFATIHEVLSGPEQSWLSSWPNHPSKELDEGSPLDEVLTEILMPVHLQIVSADMRSRAQVRLLRLHARVIMFRWENNRLPTTLSEAAPDEELTDPLSGQQLQYQALTPTTYRLFSKGNKELGEVELRYRRSPKSGRDDLPPAQ